MRNWRTLPSRMRLLTAEVPRSTSYAGGADLHNLGTSRCEIAAASAMENCVGCLVLLIRGEDVDHTVDGWDASLVWKYHEHEVTELAEGEHLQAMSHEP